MLESAGARDLWISVDTPVDAISRTGGVGDLALAPEYLVEVRELLESVTSVGRDHGLAGKLAARRRAAAHEIIAIKTPLAGLGVRIAAILRE